MKKIFLLFFISLIILPVFSENDTDFQNEEKTFEESAVLDNTQDDDTKEYNYVRNRAQVLPKKEHNKIMRKAQKSFEKDKNNFQKLKDKELWLIHDEAKLLDYHP